MLLLETGWMEKGFVLGHLLNRSFPGIVLSTVRPDRELSMCRQRSEGAA